MIAYKESLAERYAVTSANSKVAAVNCFLRTAGCEGCSVKSFKVQKMYFGRGTGTDQKKSISALSRPPQRHGKRQLGMLIQTICATGIRVSEVRYITMEAVRAGYADVALKGKIRTILLPKKLCRKLLRFAGKQKIASGEIFLTKDGRSLSRQSIWRVLKAL